MTQGAGHPSVSVIIASRGRPDELQLCLRAVRQLDYPSFEVIVVGDDAGPDWVRFVPFDRPNVSAARNAGIAAAAGEICAFIDDDSVPEPMWLRLHVAALAKADASVGFVRGPDGIRFQSRLASVDAEAETHAEPFDGTASCIPRLAPGRAVKLVGTNMAVRREALVAVNGFDPAFRYFLDDSDLSLRLARSGRRAAVAPLAEVHHALAASPARTRLRAPRTLFDIGRSVAMFLRRHPGADPDEVLARTGDRERRRAIRAMIKGACEPRDVSRLMATLKRGWQAGLSEELPVRADIGPPTAAFLPVQPIPSGQNVIACRFTARRTARQEAARIVAGQARASIFSFSLTSVPHSVRYIDGYWLHSGGQFRMHGSDKLLFKWCRFASRVVDETHRVAIQRGIDQGNPGRILPG